MSSMQQCNERDAVSRRVVIMDNSRREKLTLGERILKELEKMICDYIKNKLNVMFARESGSMIDDVFKAFSPLQQKQKLAA